MNCIKNLGLLVLCLLLAAAAKAQPNADFTSNIKQGCVPLLVQFNSHSTVQSGSYTHSWDLGGPSSAQTNPSRLFTAPGVYTIKHTVTGPGGSNTVTKTNYIEVFPKPTVSFSGSPTMGCPPLTVNFTDNSNLNVAGAGTYLWIFTNSAPSTAKNPTNVYNDGPYDVSLTVTNSKGCSETLVKKQYINVHPTPTISFTASKTEFCSAPGTTTFTGSASGTTGPYRYEWDFGDFSPTAYGKTPTHTYTGPAPQTYTVKMKVYDSSTGCTFESTNANYIRIYKPDASFTAPDSVCVGTPVTFTNTSASGASTHQWNFDDGSGWVSTPASTVAHAFHSTGTFNVRLISTYGNSCPDTFIKKIYVRPQPDIDFYIDPDTLCPAPQTVKFATYNPMVQYLWDFGDGNSSTAASPTHTYTQNGQYTITLIATNQFGCKDTLTKEGFVKIFPLYIDARSDKEKGCVPLSVNFNVDLYRDSGYYYPYPVKTYKWYFGNGDSSTSASPVYTYTDSGVFQIIVKIETVQGCIIYDTLQVEAGLLPTANFTATPLVVCNNQSVYFTNLSTGWPPMEYEWDFGDGSVVAAENPVYAYGKPGKYTVKLTASHHGCKDTFMRVEYIEVLEPDAKFTYSVDCINPLKVHLANGSTGNDSNWWDFGDGSAVARTINAVHTYTSPGSYTVTLKVYNDSTKCYDEHVESIYIGDNPLAFVENKRNLCINDSVSFKGFLSASPREADYKWYINGALIKQELKVDTTRLTYTFFNPGQYTVMLVVAIDSCIDTLEKVNWITVGDPIPGFVADTTHFCIPDTVHFLDTSKGHQGTYIVSRYWNFGRSTWDTATTSKDTISRVYPTRGQYTITLRVTDNIGCTNTIILPQHINAQKPVAGFTVPDKVCLGQTVSFNDTSLGIDTHLWYFGDGDSSTDAFPKHIYKSKGSFNPMLIAKDNLGCTDTMVFNSVNVQQPTASFTMSDSVSICPNFIVKFTSTSIGAQTRKWNFDNGNVSGLIAPTTIFTTPKKYNISLVVTDALGCTDTAYNTVQVLGYAGVFTYDTTSGCVPTTVNFTSQVLGQVPSMIWDFGDGTTTQVTTGGTIQYTYTTPGKYLPKMVFNDGLGCNTYSDGLDTIYVDQAIADFETGPLCEFSLIEFKNKSTSALSNMRSYYWEFDNGQFSALKDPKRKYGAAGKYSVMLAVGNDRGCKDTVVKELTINKPLPVSAGDDTVKCMNDSVMLEPAGGVSYLWSPGATLSCTSCENPWASPKVRTQYTVISTDINGCHDTDNIWIDIKTHVESIVGKGGEVCAGDSIRLHASGAKTYSWSPSGSLDNPSSASPLANPYQTTKYTVVAFEGSCIPDTNSVNVKVHPLPVIEIRGEQRIVAGNTADLFASATYAERYLWSPSATLTCDDCQNPIASPYKTTRYVVKVFTEFGCVDSAGVTVTVLCDKSQVYIPNTFTPNGDGVNDIFIPRGVGITSINSFRVYNRWGQVMFERNNIQINDKENGWDGTRNGEELTPDVYVYTVEAVCENGELLKLKGDITIIR